MRELPGNCPLCSLACPLVIKGGERGPLFGDDSFLTVEWDKCEGSKFGGSLCARGVSIAELLTHEKRLNCSFVLGERTSLEAAISETAKNLQAVKEESGGESIGVLVGDGLTNEEAALALRFARDVLGTPNIALFAPDDIPLFRAWLGCDLSGLRASGEKPAPANEVEVTLVLGDSFTDHPCTAKVVLPGRYGARGSEIIAVAPDLSHTAWFSNRLLRCRPGGEAAVAAGLLKAAAARTAAPLTADLKKLIDGIEWNEIERIGGAGKDDIDDAAASLLGAGKVRTYISNIFGRMGAPALASLFAEALTRICPGDARFHPQFVQQNTWGIYSVLGGGSVLEKLGGSELKALVLLGLDLFSVCPAAPVEKALREYKFTVATQLFWSQTAARANVVIPAASLIEKKGTVSPEFGEDLVRANVPEPLGGTLSDGEFIVRLAGEMGSELPGDVPVERKTKRSGSCGWLGADWSGYTGAMRELDSAEAVLIPWSEPVHAADGSISRNFKWSDMNCSRPELMVSPEFAVEVKLGEGDIATVKSDGGEAALAVKLTRKLKGNVVGATIHFPSVRKLFPWKLDKRHGEISVAPIPVHIGRQGKKR